MKKLIIEAAINEAASKDTNLTVPYGPEEIAAEAIACAEAGAAIVHFHARDPVSGDQAWLGTELYADAMRRIERECDAILYPTYSARFPIEERFSHLEGLAAERELRFEMGTIDLGAVNMAAFVRETKELGPDHVYSNTHAEVRRLPRGSAASSTSSTTWAFASQATCDMPSLITRWACCASRSCSSSSSRTGTPMACRRRPVASAPSLR